MDVISKVTIRIVFITISLFYLLLAGHVTYCYASDQNNSKYQHSKDYKNFPVNSPEAVLTAFVGADLGDIFNRNNDDRYPLWWGLTELGGVPDNDGYLKLYIKSYKITTSDKASQANHKTLNLELDVRVIWSSGNPKDISIINWRSIPVTVGDTSYLSNTQQFVKAVLGNNANRVLKKEVDFYPVTKNNRSWVIQVQMIKKNGKWLIATKTLPFQSAYVNSEVLYYKEEVGREIETNKVCEGKRGVDQYIMERQLDYVKKEIGKSFKKFRAKFCTENDLKVRSRFIEGGISTIQKLNSAAEN